MAVGQEGLRAGQRVLGARNNKCKERQKSQGSTGHRGTVLQSQGRAGDENGGQRWQTAKSLIVRNQIYAFGTLGKALRDKFGSHRPQGSN